MEPTRDSSNGPGISAIHSYQTKRPLSDAMRLALLSLALGIPIAGAALVSGRFLQNKIHIAHTLSTLDKWLIASGAALVAEIASALLAGVPLDRVVGERWRREQAVADEYKKYEQLAKDENTKELPEQRWKLAEALALLPAGSKVWDDYRKLGINPKLLGPNDIPLIGYAAQLRANELLRSVTDPNQIAQSLTKWIEHPPKEATGIPNDDLRKALAARSIEWNKADSLVSDSNVSKKQVEAKKEELERRGKWLGAKRLEIYLNKIKDKP